MHRLRRKLEGAGASISTLRGLGYVLAETGMSPEAIPATFSLRRRLAWSLIPPLAALLLLNAFWFYKGANDAANRPQ